MAAETMRLYSAMLDSLAGSFRLADATGKMMFSMHPRDVAEMLAAVRDDLNARLGPMKKPRA